ncbi:sensor histidine kinase [Nocardioides sp. LML1-1-1.1]
MLVGAVMVVGLLEGVFREDVTWRPVVTVVTVGLAPVLLWRRTHPLVCVVVVLGAGLALGLASQVAGVSEAGLATMTYVLVLVHALVRWGSGREIVAGLAVAAVVAGFSGATDYTGPAELFGGLAVLVAAVALGAALRYRAENRRRAFDQVRSEERVGLARDLHDSVAHHVSAIAVQAQTGRTIGRRRPEAALEALAAIEGEASRTLAEMRSMVRVLRDGAPADYAPRPGVADLASLARSDPAPVVHVELAGDLTAIGPQVDAAVYRMAQEALTNALRHARGASRVEIRVAGSAGRVRLRVTDDGRAGTTRPASPGFGLLGMGERVKLLGGTLHAGPAPEGGWAVEADLPTEGRR